MTGRTATEEERLVDGLRPFMLQKLAEHRAKGHWGREHPLQLLHWARRELDEVRDALEAYLVRVHDGCAPGPSDAELAEAVALECADAANFLAMLADVVTGRES